VRYDQRLQPEDGTHLGPYELLGRLGEGGMGVVYLGRDDRGEVAIKVRKQEYADRRRARRRLHRELDAALRVPRYCTARIYGYDLDNDPPYIVSEYIDGPTLNKVVRTQGPLDDSKLHSLAIAVAGALKEIHLAGVIHGDLTPRNVMLSLHGPRVLDFGIARVPEQTVSSSIEIAGTPPYMTPEHFSNGEVTTAADVFAWGSAVAAADRPDDRLPPEVPGRLVLRWFHPSLADPDRGGARDPWCANPGSPHCLAPTDQPVRLGLVSVRAGNGGPWRRLRLRRLGLVCGADDPAGRV
jgi:serine/threonine protein kinase